MSFLSKLLGGDFKSNREEGEELFKEGHFGEAKLAFERAMSKAKKENRAETEGVKKSIHLCKNELAKLKISEADQEVSMGDIDAAYEALDEARDICDDEDIAKLIEDRVKNLESQDARELAGEGEEMSDDGILAIIAGTWSEPQAKEYSAMPDTLKEALLAIHDGDNEKAAEILKELTSRGDLPLSPKYLWFELGDALLSSRDEASALEAYNKFLDSIEDDENVEEKAVLALNQKARALVGLKREDDAKEALIEATRFAGEDHAAFLSLGVFLRFRGHNEEAFEALTKAAELMGQMQPDFAVIRELGLTCLAMNKKPEAKAHLESVIKHLASQGQYDQFDPETAVTLAKLYEENRDYRSAADLYRHLAVGYDIANHFAYNLESARLVKLAGEDRSLFKKYLIRARELAKDDEEISIVDKARAALEK